mgnify:CR=1 FL=1
MDKQTVKVGLMGLGTVGTGVVRIIDKHQEDLHKQSGSRIVVEKILVQEKEKERAVSVSPDRITDNPRDILHHSDIDIVIEVIGGVDTARAYIKEALLNGKHVVTANKDLMALHGAELLQVAEENGCDLFYEASVAGGIPIIRTLVEGLASDRITKIIGIVNGTTNYILSKMSQEGVSFQDVLQEAQQLGYAEAAPTADGEGVDAARKMATLGTLGLRMDVALNDVDVSGISEVTSEDIAYAKRLGYEMKLVGIARHQDGMIDISVQPTMIPNDHPLASVNGVYNAVYVYGEAVGETMFYGPGAGELPTATAVVSDLVTVVKNMRLGVNGRGTVAPYREKKVKTAEQTYSKYFLRLHVADRAGVLAKITQLFADHDISLEKVLQVPHNGGYEAEIVLITHSASKFGIERVKEQMEQLDIINRMKSCYRVEGSD